jgi:Kef-type K+ transport system membrane component KefB
MVEVDATLIILLIILSLGLIIPELFKRFRLPFVTILILIGAIIGPNGFGYIELNNIIEFFGFLGMAFLMLMAGVETDLRKVRKFKSKVIIMSFLNGVIPFSVGVIITRLFGYSWLTSFIIGVVFISSSVAIIVPSLTSAKIFNKEIGQLILSSVLIADIFSLIVLGFIFQNISPVTRLPIFVYYVILLFSIALLFYLVPKISSFALKKISKDNGYESGLRFVIVLTLFSLVFFSVLGVHPILAAFLVGLMLSGIVHSDKSGIIYSKIHTLGYGLFVPVFFFVIGMEMDLSLFKEFNLSNILMISLILGLIFSKLISGFLAGKIVKLGNRDSLTFGAISIVQLTTTLAVTFAASSLGLLDNVLVTSIILLSIITTFIGPIAVSLIVGNRKK